MKRVIASILILFSVLLTIVAITIPDQWLMNGTMILGWLLFTLQYLSNNFENVYLLKKRIWFNIKNPECIWNMTVSFSGLYDRKSLDHVDAILHDKKNRLNVLILSNTRRQYRFGTISFEVSVDENTGELHISIHDLEVSYRRSKELISRELGGLFENIMKSLKPDKDTYGLQIEFRDYNPYFGFYVRRLNAKDIQGFNVTFKIDNDRVSVNKNGIEINTDNLHQLTKISREYLSLSPAK